MTRKTIIILTLIVGCATASGCAPLVGAGVAIVADDQAERQGGNLF